MTNLTLSLNDPGASLLLTSGKAVFCKIFYFMENVRYEYEMLVIVNIVNSDALWPREKERLTV